MSSTELALELAGRAEDAKELGVLVELVEEDDELLEMDKDGSELPDKLITTLSGDKPLTFASKARMSAMHACSGTSN